VWGKYKFSPRIRGNSPPNVFTFGETP